VQPAKPDQWLSLKTSPPTVVSKLTAHLVRRGRKTFNSVCTISVGFSLTRFVRRGFCARLCTHFNRSSNPGTFGRSIILCAMCAFRRQPSQARSPSESPIPHLAPTCGCSTCSLVQHDIYHAVSRFATRTIGASHMHDRTQDPPNVKGSYWCGMKSKNNSCNSGISTLGQNPFDTMRLAHKPIDAASVAIFAR